MGVAYRVDTGAVTAAASRIKAERDLINTALAAIKTALETATPTAWLSPAAASLEALKTPLQGAGDGMLAAIDSITARMDRTVRNYEGTEYANLTNLGGDHR